MNNWECGVCGFVNKEGEAPEKCPICEAPKVMFTEVVQEQANDAAEQENTEIKQWRCTISGYLHSGVAPPEKCPICEATADMFEEVVEHTEKQVEAESTEARRWRCTICGHIHTGPEPPESCPICAAPKSKFVEIDAAGKAIGELVPDPEETAALAIEDGSEAHESSFFNKIARLILKFHLHPITAHFPNGILPAVLIFLCICVLFQIPVLEKVAFYNLIFVLVMLPAVLVTGFAEWQQRYKGAKTALFITKILCAIVVLGSVNILVFWRLIDPQVAMTGSPYQYVYLGIAAVMLGAAGIAGHLGGKLVFAGRG